MAPNSECGIFRHWHNDAGRTRLPYEVTGPHSPSIRDALFTKQARPGPTSPILQLGESAAGRVAGLTRFPMKYRNRPEWRCIALPYRMASRYLHIIELSHRTAPGYTTTGAQLQLDGTEQGSLVHHPVTHACALHKGSPRTARLQGCSAP